MKKSVNFIFAILTVFIFGFLVWNSSEDFILNSKNTDFPKEVNSKIEQNHFHFNSEGTQNEAFSFNARQQSQTHSNQIVRKLIFPFFYEISFHQIEFFYKNSFEVLFDKKNFLNLFFTTSIIIFPFHYFW